MLRKSVPGLEQGFWLFTVRASHSVMSPVFLVFAYFFLALAIVGIVVPGLPTVPFLLLAAWFAARGSAKLHTWLYEHPTFGKLLIDWEQQKAVSLGSKIVAVLMLIFSWTLMYYRFDNAWLLGGLALFFILIASYLISRPLPK